MSVCAVLTCKNKGVHKFPIDETLRKRWIRATRIDVQKKVGWNLRTHSCICSEHFVSSDFEARGKQILLRKTAVPSIFPWTSVTPSNIDSIDEPPLSDDNFKIFFDPLKATIDYSKPARPISFVEEYPDLLFDNAESVIDPLLISPNDDVSQQDCTELENTSFSSSFCPEESGLEEIIDIEDHEELLSSSINHPAPREILTCDQSLQCDLTEADKRTFSVYKYKESDKAIHFFTGLETYDKLMYVFSTLGDSSNLKYFYKNPPNWLNSFEQFFMTLMILRRHREFEDIGMLYLISVKQVTNIFITWVRFMALQWQNLDLWLDKNAVQTYMPLDFFDKFPMTRVVLDATECPIKKPGLPKTQQITFSSYKNRNTVKFLIGIAPSGLITYISPCFGGSATDRQIIERSSILTRFNYNDEIMVDKGLNVQDIFLPYGVKVNIPTFFKKGSQIEPDVLKKDRKIASKRVHVERVIGMLKTFKILKEPLNMTETTLSSEIAFICSMLVNFRSNIISKYA